MAKLPEMKLAHVGIWVQDFERMKNFYVRMFGFGVADEGLLNGNSYAFLSRDPRDHHQVVVAEGRKPETDQTTVNQISFKCENCLLYTSPSPRDLSTSRMPSSA